MSTLYVDNLQPNLGSRVMAAGHVVQVVSANKTDVFTASLTSTKVGITGLSASITPSSTSSKILVMSNVFVASNVALFYHFWLFRDGSIVQGATGDGAGSRTRDYGFFYTGNTANNVGQNLVLPQYLDSPATTSSTTYQIYTGDPNNAGSTMTLNKVVRDGDFVYEPRCISTITLMEIAQ